jgi:hypothetical protein
MVLKEYFEYHFSFRVRHSKNTTNGSVPKATKREYPWFYSETGIQLAPCNKGTWYRQRKKPGV